MLGNPVFFVPMTFIRTDIKFGGGFALESVVSVVAVTLHLMFRQLRRKVDVFSPLVPFPNRQFSNPAICLSFSRP